MAKIECRIREILSGEGDINKKVELICSFMTWDKVKLKESILRHGLTPKGKNKIIEEFWG